MVVLNREKLKNVCYLLCNHQAEILDVLMDDYGLVDKNNLPISFRSIIAMGSMGKAADLWKEIVDKGFASNYELYVQKENEVPQALQFSAGTLGNKIWIIAAPHNDTMEKMLSELMHINNEQQNLIRSAKKEISRIKKTKPSEFDAYDEISRVNNELINVQRKLVKQNEEILYLNRKLSETNKAIEHFAYTVSHDLKEPLRMVKSFMGLLKKKYEYQLDEKAQQYIYFAIDGAERMERLITDLLEYSRVGRLNVPKEKTDVNEVLDNVLKLNRSLINELGAGIHYPKLPVIECQRVAIQQLFHNLIGNSLKYRKPDVVPEITITCEAQKKYWEFSIKDNGRGIALENHKLIFDLFRRVHEESEESGSGMGLAICKKIVNEHGGDIWVESEIGAGSTFYFTLEK
ncbi:MAG: hypothetical protein EA359_01955 [Balneolaceae bacterium]|nr:MAG: hypothetical protein EA359_01955 [Balneolaceae bacterium]